MESAGKSVGLLHSIGTSSPSLGGTPHSKKSISNDSAASRGRVACRGHSHGPIHSDAPQPRFESGLDVDASVYAQGMDRSMAGADNHGGDILAR